MGLSQMVILHSVLPVQYDQYACIVIFADDKHKSSCTAEACSCLRALPVVIPLSFNNICQVAELILALFPHKSDSLSCLACTDALPKNRHVDVLDMQKVDAEGVFLHSLVSAP